MANDIFVNNAYVGRASSQDGTRMVEIVFLVGIYYFQFGFLRPVKIISLILSRVKRKLGQN